MKCRDCHFYNETIPKEKLGLCEVKLPPWIDKLYDPKFKPNIVARTEGCDFGKPKEEDDEL